MMGEPGESNAYHLVYLEQCWEDWRHYNNLIWQLPSVTVVIVGALLGIAYYSTDEAGFRAMLSFLAAFFSLVMFQALRKHRKFHGLRTEAIQRTIRSKISKNILDPIRGDPTEAPEFSAYRYLRMAMALLVIVTSLIFLWNLTEWAV